jgi:hypothetical protein
MASGQCLGTGTTVWLGNHATGDFVLGYSGTPGFGLRPGR